MGKQVRFYALKNDNIRFLEFVSSIPQTTFLATSSPNGSIDAFIISTPEELLFQNTHKSYVYRGDLSALRSYVRKGNRIVYSEEKLSYIDTGEIFYWIDGTNAPVIEFSPSFLREDGTLAQGRIWAAMYRLEGEKLIYQGDPFGSFYETLAKWIRAKFKKRKDVDGYFGVDALAWYEKGGQISP